MDLEKIIRNKTIFKRYERYMSMKLYVNRSPYNISSCITFYHSFSDLKYTLVTPDSFLLSSNEEKLIDNINSCIKSFSERIEFIKTPNGRLLWELNK